MICLITSLVTGMTLRLHTEVRLLPKLMQVGCLNHQYLVLHLKSNEIVPWWGVQMEYYQYIGYNHYKQRYTIHGMSIEGDEDLSEGFCYGYRNGNDFKTVAKFGADTSIVQHLIWQPETNTWLIQSKAEVNGKEGNIFLDMKLTAEKPSVK